MLGVNGGDRGGPVFLQGNIDQPSNVLAYGIVSGRDRNGKRLSYAPWIGDGEHNLDVHIIIGKQLIRQFHFYNIFLDK